MLLGELEERSRNTLKNSNSSLFDLDRHCVVLNVELAMRKDAENSFAKPGVGVVQRVQQRPRSRLGV
jgi:hypothetical protein